MQRESQQDDARTRPTRRPLAVGLCAALLVAFAVTARSAVRHKCATMDEPLHSTAAYLLTRFGDYRINPEDPPLWQRWAALAEPRDALHVNLADPRLTETLQDFYGRWTWLLSTLYETKGNDAIAFVMRLRTMLILLGVALGVMIAWWAWRLRGAVAAVAATVLFALDPNFLAHAGLVKNDMAISLVSFALAYATWRAGMRLTWGSAAAVVLLVAAALVTKFSGPLVVIAWLGLLAVRAMMTASWPCFGREVRSRAGRLAVALLLAVVAAGVSDGVIWANYSFRFNPTPDGQSWQTADLLHDDAVSEIRARHPDQGVSPAEFEAWRPGAFLRTVQFLRRHRLLPDTYLVGLMYTYSQSHVRPAFLCGRIYSTGSVAYFPLVFAFKTPLATQLLLLLAAVVTIGAMVRRAPVRHDDAMSRSSIAWTAACLWLPFGVIAVAALTAHLNLGIRHILPLYPVLYVAGGCGAARVWRQGGRFGRLALVLLAAGLAAETIAAFPNYIPFFNVACGGSRGGLALLSDSNLDWGQDLPLLAAWQKRNPDRRLYLCYFGSADPLYYGIRYTPLPGTRTLRDKATHPTFPREPGVIAISATQLQGLYLNEQQRQIYGTLRDQQPPLSVLGGSIYLYEYNP